MSTVDKVFADRIVAGNGYVDGDADNSLGDNPRCVMITRYDNAWGGVGYGLTFEGQVNVYRPTRFVRNPTVYWTWKRPMHFDRTYPNFPLRVEFDYNPSREPRCTVVDAWTMVDGNLVNIPLEILDPAWVESAGADAIAAWHRERDVEDRLSSK